MAKEKELLTVSAEFVDQVLNVIADESENGRKKIISITEAAESRYEKPINSWITGLIYRYTRVRGDEVNQSIQVMKQFPDAFTRLQEFKLLISKGAWNYHSYNDYLFQELIKAIPGYRALDEQLIHTLIIPQLKNLIIARIDDFMAKYQANLKAMKLRDVEREETRKSSQHLLDHVLLFNNQDLAKEAAISQADKTVFYLTVEKNTQSKLFWLDVTGKINALEAGKELTQQLMTSKNKDLTQLKPESLERMKKECMKAKDSVLAKIQLLINPKDEQTNGLATNETLRVKSRNSTFVLRYEENEMSLWWINSLGKSNQIALANYPQLNDWLHARKGSLNEKDVVDLKMYLLHVDTTQKIGTEKKVVLESFFAKRQHKMPGDQIEVKKMTAVAPRTKLDLGKFKDIEILLQSRTGQLPSEPEVPKKPVSKDDPAVVKDLVKKDITGVVMANRSAMLSQLSSIWKQQRQLEEDIHDAMDEKFVP